jgi:hypothetical protein
MKKPQSSQKSASWYDSLCPRPPAGKHDDAGPDLSLLGNAGRHLVSADVCQAAQITGSPHQLTSSRISQKSDVVLEVGDSPTTSPPS